MCCSWFPLLFKNFFSLMLFHFFIYYFDSLARGDISEKKCFCKMCQRFLLPIFSSKTSMVLSEFFESVWEEEMLGLLSMFGKIHLWSHLVQHFSLLGVFFDYCFNFVLEIGLLLTHYWKSMFLGIHAFFPGCQVCCPIVVCKGMLLLFVFFLFNLYCILCPIPFRHLLRSSPHKSPHCCSWIIFPFAQSLQPLFFPLTVICFPSMSLSLFCFLVQFLH